MGEEPQPEREMELCTPDVVNLPIINLQDARRPFKIKVTTIHMVQHSPFTDALEREYMRAEFLEWHIGLLMRRMEKMDIEREAQDLKAAKARSTCEECEEYDHVQGKPLFNASSSIQDLVPLCAYFKNFMDEQGTLPTDSEAALRSGARAAQAPALLRGPPGYGGLLVPVGADHP
jgi:hypothetical protein